MESYIKETPLLNYSHTDLQKLVKERKWNQLEDVKKVKTIYNFVRDEIKFGYNKADDISAVKVLYDGYGQCNTKSTLLMALLRSVQIPCKIHGFTIDKALQKGAIQGIWYKLSPQNILHTWVEVFVNNSWYNLEGVIVDKEYLDQLKSKNEQCKTFCGYGVYTNDFQNPLIDWDLNDTYIQNLGINNDFGVYDSPDELYAKHQQKLNFFKRIIFSTFVRKLMNKNVDEIRNSKKIK